jgi:hypothetical protein
MPCSRAPLPALAYGQRCWEADILHVAVIENALDRHIRSWLNVTQWKRRIAEIERARKLL